MGLHPLGGRRGTCRDVGSTLAASGTKRNQNASSWHLAHGDSSDVGVSGLKGEKIAEIINTHRKDAPRESWGHRKSRPEAG